VKIHHSLAKQHRESETMTSYVRQTGLI